MKRMTISPRKDWQLKLEQQGMPYHSAGGTYWQDDIYYELSGKEADKLSDITELHYEAIHNTVKKLMEDTPITVRNHLREANFSEGLIDEIFDSWYQVGKYKLKSHYGRFDYAYTKNGDIVMFEYNADTPVCIIETYCQWNWAVDQFGADVSQFNYVYENLYESFEQIYNSGVRDMIVTCDKGQIGEVYEYEATALYLTEIAQEVGIPTKFRFVSDLNFDWDGVPVIRDEDNVQPDAVFKLYPTEWMVMDLEDNGCPNAHKVVDRNINKLYEEPYKLLLGGKWLLPYLPKIEGFTKAWSTRDECLDKKVVAKSYYGRIGMEVEVLEPYQLTTLTGGVVYQEFQDLMRYDGRLATIGSWYINGKAAGIVIREQFADITKDNCCFASHIVV